MTAPTASYTKSQIEEFLAKESLGCHRIELPFGLATPGHDRRQTKEIAFSDEMRGKTVLDIRSRLGSFCLEALSRGAARVVGLESNRERIRQAETLARFLGLSPEYVHANVEDRPSLGRFDIVLCLNVLQQVRDPIALLRYLALNTRQHLLIESTAFGLPNPQQRRKTRRLLPIFVSRQQSARSATNMDPLVHVGFYSPARMDQAYFFTPAALRRILDGHMRLFHRIEEFESECEGRFLLRCTRLQFDRLVVVSGVNSSGKSTLCRKIIRNEFAEQLAIPDMSNAPFIRDSRFWKGEANHQLAKARNPLALLHYDITVIDSWQIDHFGRDPGTDLLRCADSLDVIIVAPQVATLQRQLISAAPRLSQSKRRGHMRRGELYGRPSFLTTLYSDWIEFCATVAANYRFRLYTEDGGGRMSPPLSRNQTLAAVREIYGGAPRG